MYIHLMLIATLIVTGQERNDELYMYSVYIVTIYQQVWQLSPSIDQCQP